MMVIAVIGILAAVLVPKMGGLKDNAKLAGVESNVR
ncbi:type II secretion system protein [Peptococcaceae bacterium 1198_IL3148]